MVLPFPDVLGLGGSLRSVLEVPPTSTRGGRVSLITRPLVIGRTV
jgi:hypothetical protein